MDLKNPQQRGTAWILNGPPQAKPGNPNETTFLITHGASERFIEQIQTERKAGYGFVPFIGAGFSAPSGAPIVNELKQYLQRCIWLALALGNDVNRWHPLTDQWPAFIDRCPQMAGYWSGLLSGQFSALLSKLSSGEDILPEIKKELPVMAEAYGAMVEWRTSLLFLSRLGHPARGDGYDLATLGAPRHEIVDSCLRELMKGRYPALNHKMLGVLAGALRLNLVLTTNFDDLLERGFAEARNPLEAFEVHIGDALPHWSAFADTRALVKLHGSRHLLRVDYSLDAEPSQEDKDRFVEYLLADKGRRSNISDEYSDGLPFQNHLLIMGVAGKDRRTRELVKYAGSRLNDNFRVFWLCYSDEDVRSLEDFSREYCSQPATEPCLEADREGCRLHRAKFRHGPIVLKQTNYGLLLLQLYQTIRKNLPPFGTVFPSASRIPLPPLQGSSRVGGGAVSLFCNQILNRLKEFGQDGFSKRRLLIVSSPDTVHGVTSACSDVFAQLERDNVCLWLDMNDISSTDNLFEVLLESAYYRLGQDNWVPTYREVGKKRPLEITYIMSSVNRPWIIFLNARETPGANTSSETLNPDHPHGWIDMAKPSSEDPSSCMEEFVELIDQLCTPRTPKISVVLMCRHETPNGVIQHLKKDKKTKPEILLEGTPFSELANVSEAIIKAGRNRGKQRFVHALILMQRPRLLATIWSDAVTAGTGISEISSEDSSANEKVEWLNELEATGLLRRKAGGFVWVHSRCRGVFRSLLRRNGHLLKRLEKESPAAFKLLKEWDVINEEPQIHTRLARWYERVLNASDSPAAAFEAVYHLCRAAEGYLDQPDRKRYGKEAQQRLEAGVALLRSNLFLIQTNGYARGSCRRLNHLRRDLCGELLRKLQPGETRLQASIRDLQMTCTEVMRAIAREVGEQRKAYIRHQQFGLLSAGRSLDEIREGDHILGKDQITRLIYEHLFGDKKGSKGQGKGQHPDYANTKAIVQWVRWWRWSGMLGATSRSYEAASSSFRQALQYAEHPEGYRAGKAQDSKRSGSAEMSAEAYLPYSAELQVEVLRVIEQYAELLLLRYSLARRDKQKTEWNKLDKKLKVIERLILNGRELAATIRRQEHSIESDLASIASWCDCRLLVHYSAATSRRLQLESQKDETFTEERMPITAMGLLGQAEATLGTFESRRNRSELAMVELHRAQARLWAAEEVRVPIKNADHDRKVVETITFAEMCTKLRELVHADERRFQREVTSRFEIKAVEPSLRRAKSLVADGIHFLRRAEPILRERRRNVWWTTWYFERYLRCIALSVWASVFENDTPIPFLGLEAAPLHVVDMPHDELLPVTTTLADEMLVNAVRMISVDPYRLATIIDAYASCLNAFTSRLSLDPVGRTLQHRQQIMKVNIGRALKGLDKVKERRRLEVAAKEPDAYTQMDEDAIAYVDSVRQRVADLAAN